MGSTIFTFKCSFGHRKGPAKESELKSPAKKKFYAERKLPPPSRPNTAKDNSEQSQPEKEKDAEESTGSGESPSDEMSKTKQMSSDFGPVIVDSKVSKNIEKLDRKPIEEGALEKTELYKGKLDGMESRHHSTPPKPIGQTATTSSERTSVSSGKDSLNGKRMVTSAAQISDKPETIHRNLNELHQMPGESHNTSAFESSYIGEEGGVIQSSKYGFSLRIPPGAIPKGQRKKIGVGLSRDHGATGSGGGVSISPMICSEPSGLELEKPARFDLQHCLSSWSNDTRVNVHEMADDGKHGGETEGHKGAKCSIGTNGELALEVTRLGRYSLTVMGSEVYKKLVCRPFIPKKMPTTKKPIINVLIYDLTDGMKKMMMEEIENESPYPIIPAHIGKNFIFNLSGKDAPEILLTCHAVGSMEVKSLSVSELIEFKSNSVDFQVDCSDGQAKDITIQLSFGNKKIDMICHVDIPFAGHKHHSTPSRMSSRESVYTNPRKPSSSSSDFDHQTDVPSQVLHEIAGEVPHNYYIPFGLKLGLEKAKLDSILVGCANDSEEATYRAMEAWKNRIGVDNRERLRDILIAGDLKRIAEKYLN